MLDYEKRPYRPCVGICLMNDDGKIFAGKRIDNRAEAWQMPQGGIDEGESAITACFREMAEEIGTNSAELVTEYPGWLNYDIPEALANKLWQGTYRGQTQKWMLLRFTGQDSDININTEEPEFASWQWMAPEDLISLAVPFKRDVYETLMASFSEHLG
ncbi:MAG: RNA pyrophosphohydrolase [Candidatus Puniceispirillaceae bacterium]